MKRIKKGWMSLRVEKVIHETHDTDTFYFVDADEGERAFDYVAGQYLTFRYDEIGSKPLVRSYTMSSSPNQPQDIAVTVKRVEKGVVSNWMCDHLKVGSILKARGPIGKFVYDHAIDQKHLVMVAGGSGVTPFVSILREYGSRLGQGDAPHSMTLLVSYRSKKDLILWDDLQKASKIPGVRVITTLSREQSEGFWHGRIDDTMLSRLLEGRYDNTSFMTCGPDAIMSQVVQHARNHNVPESCIKQESFES